MWCKTHPYSIYNVSGLIYNNAMETRCNMCMNIYDEIVVMDCDVCLTDDYLMDMSVPSDTIAYISERK